MKIFWMFAVAAMLLLSSALHSEASSLTNFGLNISIPPNIVGRFLPDFTPQINDFINTGKQIGENIKNDASKVGIPTSGLDIGQSFVWLKDLVVRGYLFVQYVGQKIVSPMKL